MKSHGITPAIATANKTVQVVRQRTQSGTCCFLRGAFFAVRRHAEFACDRRHVCIHLYNYCCECMHLFLEHANVYIHVRIYIYMYIYIYIYMYVYIYIYICMYV